MSGARDSEALPPLVGGILVGGASRRMGSAKALLEWHGETFVERIMAALTTVVPEVALLGGAPDLPPRLAGLRVIGDLPGAQGPLAGLLAAFAARPDTAWLIVTCDQPLLSAATLEWLIGERRVDRIAVLPRLVPWRIEPFPGIYEPGCRAALAALAESAASAATAATGPGASSTAPGRGGSLQPLAGLADVCIAPVPPALRGALRGVNTPAEWVALQRRADRAAKDPDCA